MTGVERRPSAARTVPVPRRVLLIEDNADGRETLRILLEIWGHRVNVAANGREGLDLAITQKPDVAVIDIGLPEIDGYEVARRLRAAFGPDIVLIALTGYSRPDDRRRVFQSGFDYFLSKPADLGELSTMLAVGPPGPGARHGDRTER